MEYPSCVCALRGRQAATRNGFPVDPEKRDRWLLLRSPWTRHQLLVTYESPKFVVATASTALATEAAREFVTWDGATPPGTARAFCADAGAPLHALIKRFYQLALALPPEPLLEFEEKVAGLPRQTEAERLVVQRIGQDVFRKSLMEYWRATCPITGITQPELLRASHIKPWADCASDAERLDVFNGLLLAAHIDAAFDAALITFMDDGTLIRSSRLTEHSSAVLGLHDGIRLPGLTPRHAVYLAQHRQLCAAAESIPRELTYGMDGTE
jgi:putative restriction endonuclease